MAIDVVVEGIENTDVTGPKPVESEPIGILYR